MMNKMRKMKNKKGFTLMEMLIVVAIIAILIAIAIPTFASSLNKARIATDEANIRAGYASVMAEVLVGENDIANGTAYTLQADGSVATTTDKAYKCQSTSTDPVVVGGVTATGTLSKGATVTYTYNSTDGKVTITITAGK